MQHVMSGAWESCYTPCWLGNGGPPGVLASGPRASLLSSPMLVCKQHQPICVRITIQTLWDKERTRIVSSCTHLLQTSPQPLYYPSHSLGSNTKRIECSSSREVCADVCPACVRVVDKDKPDVHDVSFISSRTSLPKRQDLVVGQPMGPSNSTPQVPGHRTTLSSWKPNLQAEFLPGSM